MKFMTSRFAIAVHVLTLIGSVPDSTSMTSELMAGSIGVNPVIVRSVTGLLRNAGLLETHRGVPGARLTRPPAEIALLDVYRATEQDRRLFAVHERPNPRCPVGARIQSTLETVFAEVQAAMEARLAAITLAQVIQLNSEGQHR